MGRVAAAGVLLHLLAAVARGQDAVEVKSNDGAATPQVRLSVTSGSTTADVWVRRSRLRFDSGAGTEGFLNVSSSDAASPVAGDLRFDGTNLLFYNGAWQTVATSGSATTAVILAPSSAQAWSAPNPGIFLNENGAGTPNLLQLQRGGADMFVVNNSGTVTSGTWNGSVVATAYGGTGLGSSGASGNYLRSNGTTWTSSALQASDLPSGSANYIQNQNAGAQSSANFWISGTGRLDGGTLTLGNGTSNLIDFGAVGVAAPSAASAGWKIKTWGNYYGFGIDSGTQWYSANSTHRFYTTADAVTWTERASLDSTGLWTVTGSTRSPIYSDHNDTSYFLDANAAGAAINANANGLVLNGQLQNLSTWGMNARAQGVIIMPEGPVTDDGAGSITFGSTVIVMNPASGSWIRVAAGTYTLGAWGYLWVNTPPTGTRGTTVVPTVSAWADADVAYAGRDRIVLAQRNSGGEVFTRFAQPAKASTSGSFIQNQNASAQSANFWISGTGIASADFRAPIFYDSNNTGYYMDPASTSVVNQWNAYRYNFNGTGVDSGQSGNYYSIYQESGAWSFPYPDLVIQYHTGIKYDAYHAYGGHRFYTGYDGTGVPTGLSLTVGDQRIETPILYDQNNTAYYCDPASTTRLNAVKMTGDFQDQRLLSVKGTTDTSITTTAWTDMPQMTITFTPEHGNILVIGKVSFFSSTENVQFRILLDGATVLDHVSEDGGWIDGNTQEQTVMLVYHGTISAGVSHTIKMQWRHYSAVGITYNNSATSLGDETRNLVVMEFKD